MKLKYSFTFLLLAFFSLQLVAQEHGIKFEETTHDFGTITQGDKTEFLFKFENVSDHPVKLNHVKASCGCTTPKWTRDPIAPGDKGEIKVSYNSNRVGPFNKSVRVMYDSLSTPVMIYIKGKVDAKSSPEGEAHGDHDGHDHAGHDHAKPATPPINYSIPRGALSFEKMIQNLKSINSEQSQVVEFKFKNTSNQTVTIKDVQGEDEFTIVPKDKVLAPGMESKLIVTVDGKKMKELDREDGYFSKRITINTDEADPNANKSMTVNGNYKRIWTEAEKQASPNIEFDVVEVDGGKVIEGEKFVYDYKFRNTGKSDLMIVSTKASCGCTASAPTKDKIAPGESAAITATFNSQGRSGKQSKTITVKSNDIDSPVVTLKFTVEVIKDPFHAGGMMGGSN